MTSTITVLTDEKSNFLRLAHLIIRISPKAVRKCFDNHFPPSSLQSTLRKKRAIIDSLFNKRIMNMTQMKIIYPSSTSAQVNSSDMDVTLMICLLRNLDNLQIQDTLPFSADTSEGADLSRIKFYRNFMAHLTERPINDSEFSDIWNCLIMAISRIGGGTLKAECDAFSQTKLDSSYTDLNMDSKQLQNILKEVIEEVKELRVELNDPVPMNVKENNAVEIEVWKKDEKKYATTSASIKILKIVKENSFVVLTGSPGIGKSATARHIALLLRESDEYDILPISEPNEIIRYAKKECKQLYIIDDFCGKYLLDQNCVDLWTRLEERINQRLTSKGIKILATSRLQVWNTKSIGKFSKALNVFECNILSKEFALKTSEKRLIAKSHLGEETVKLLTDKIIREADMFPLLCKLFSNSKNCNALEFFRNPIKIYQKELEEMQQKDHGAFVGLALLVIFNNNIHKDFFDFKNTKDNYMLDQVIEECKLPAKPTKLHILERLQSLQGTYITERDNEIEAIHNNIFDIIALFFGNFTINSLLQHSRGRFICERIHFKSLDKINDSSSIIIAPKYEISYFKRIGEEVEKLRFFNVFEVNQLQCEAFQHKFISYITNNKNILQIFMENKWPLYLSVCYGYKTLTEFIMDKKSMNQMYIVKTEDTFTVKFEDFDDTDDEDVKFHIEYIRNPDACLMMACWFGHHAIAELLVNGFDVNAVDDAFETPLYLAACNNSVSIVLMLLKKGALLSNSGKVAKSPLYAVSEKGHIETVKLLLKEGANPNEPNNDNEFPLLVACENDGLLIVEELIKYGAKINQKRLRV